MTHQKGSWKTGLHQHGNSRSFGLSLTSCPPHHRNTDGHIHTLTHTHTWTDTKENENLLCATTWMGLSGIFISEISQIREKERQILCNIYMWILKIQQTTDCKWPRLAHEPPGVSSGGMGQWWPTAVLGALIAAVQARDLLKEVPLSSLLIV